MSQSAKKLELKFTSLEFLDSMVVSTVKEDIILDKNHLEKLQKACRNHYGDKSFIYIANRKNNYNVNPIIYINLLQTINLKGIAVVTENVEKLQTANFEKKFSPVPFEIFQNKEEAITWAESVS